MLLKSGFISLVNESRNLLLRSFFSTSANTISQTNPIPASFLRGGTSKGIFLNRSVLSVEQNEWGPIFLGIMGSPDPIHARQLNGMGGGISSLSKICVVGAPSPEQKKLGIDVEYTFVQVGIRDTVIDYSGNCGNLSSMIGVFAVDEGICAPKVQGGRTTVRSFNTNTQKIIDTTFPISEEGVPLLHLPETTMAGVPGKASQILLEFVNPGGARTGKLFPSGSPINRVEIPVSPGENRSIQLSLVDAANPSVFVGYAELNSFLPIDDYVQGKPSAVAHVSPILEALRQRGAEMMGLDPSAQAQPKIALLKEPSTNGDLSDNVDITVYALSMGILHKAVPMTVGLCLGVAARTPGTLAELIVNRAGAKSSGFTDNELVTISHPSGTVDVGAVITEDGTVKSAKVVRTGRRLMKGVVWW